MGVPQTPRFFFRSLDERFPCIGLIFVLFVGSRFEQQVASGALEVLSPSEDAYDASATDTSEHQII